MDISLNNLITDTLTLTDTTILGFVHQGYTNIHTYLDNLMVLVATFYVMTISLKVLYQQSALDLTGIARSLSLLVIVMTLTTHWEFYQRFVYNIFTSEPMEISRYLSGSVENGVSGINTLWNEGCRTALFLWKHAGIKNISYYFYSIAVLGATCITAIHALGLFVLAKMVVAVLLAVGPLFLLFFLFEPTREMVSGWLKALLHYALIPVITTAIVLLTSKLIEPTLTGLASSANQPKATGLIPYLGLSLVCHFLLKQVMSLSASLSGSIALEGVNALSAMARAPINTIRNAHGAHVNRQGRRLQRGKPIGRERAQRAWKNVKAKANAFRQQWLRGGNK